MEYSGAMAASVQGNDNLVEPIRKAYQEADNALQEMVTVPAGTFSAFRLPLPRFGKDIWVTPEVPFGVVKLADRDGKGLGLVALDAGATSSITETPQRMPGGSWLALFISPAA